MHVLNAGDQGSLPVLCGPLRSKVNNELGVALESERQPQQNAPKQK